jgi:hypothetical protein
LARYTAVDKGFGILDESATNSRRKKTWVPSGLTQSPSIAKASKAFHWPSGINRIYRLYREERLTVRKRRVRCKAVGTRAPILVEAKPNTRWSLDFVHDQFANGRRFRILNMVDDVTKERLGAICCECHSSGSRQDQSVIVQHIHQSGLLFADLARQPCRTQQSGRGSRKAPSSSGGPTNPLDR